MHRLLPGAVLGALLASSPALAAPDDAPAPAPPPASAAASAAIPPWAQAEVDSRRAKGIVKSILGAALLGGGTALTIAGAWPCPPMQDCSTRGIGVAAGVPLGLVGIGLLVVGTRDLVLASWREQELRAPRVSFGPGGFTLSGRF